MGIETFQRFNGQSLNEGVQWSEVGPERASADAAATVTSRRRASRTRWFWSQIEPERGKYRWSIVDAALTEAHRHGQRLAIRIMPYDDAAMPEWYAARVRSAPMRRRTRTARSGRPMPTIRRMRALGRLVTEAAGKRYNGDPDVDAMDISTVGYSGEGWGPYLPRGPIQQQLIEPISRRSGARCC